mgnify:CR=1 FL=1
MHILHVTPTYYPVRGGIETLVQRTSETLAVWGHEVTILTSDFTSVSGYYQLGVPQINPKREKLNGVNIIRLSFGNWLYIYLSHIVSILPSQKFRNLIEFYVLKVCYQRFFNLLEKQIDFLRPDVVMATPHLLPNVRAVVAAHQKNNFPLVLMPCLHEEAADWSINEMIQVLKEADRVLAMTRYEALRLSTVYGVEESRINIGGFGVDIPDTYSDEKTLRESNVLFLGRKVPGKGIPFLLEAMQIVWEKAPHIKLILAGAKSPETQVINRLLGGLPGEFQGKIASFDDISEDEKSKLLRSSLCLVLPSKIESFGGVIIEAWAHKTAIITLDLPVFSSFVDKGLDGLLVSPDNVSELAHAILQLEHDHEQARELGLAGYEKVVSQFSWEQIAHQYLITYDAIV